ncbi:MAG: NmrA/HSCARG family protein [Balneolaceae bacterium]|nr:MAG: NmrA/HSCARG family protein [Balneolaceae bacterium]
MSDKKMITVFGATGSQGGGLVHAILNDPQGEFAVRAVTRDTSSDKAKALAAAGAEVISGNIDDYSSIKNALDGAYGAYFVTFFWDHFSPEKEKEQAANMAKAAQETGLKHVIWSSLEDTRKWVPLDDDRMPTLNEKYKVPHFDGKGESEKYFTDLNLPVTFQYASFYWDNMIYFGLGPKRGDDGTLAIAFPLGNKKMAGIASEDIGKCAYGIFKKGKEFFGKTIGVSGDQLTCIEMADALTDALGEKVVYYEMTPEQFRGLGFPGSDDLGNMFQFYRDFDDVCNSTRDVARSKELNPELKSFREWVKLNASKIPVE